MILPSNKLTGSDEESRQQTIREPSFLWKRLAVIAFGFLVLRGLIGLLLTFVN